MGLFKSLCSLFTSSDEDAVSAPSNNPNTTNKVEANPPTVEKTTRTTNKSNDGMITEYVFDGEVKIGTQIKVEPLEWLFITKDGAVVDVIQEGIYVVNESSLPIFTSSVCYTVKLLESDKFRWGTIKPIIFADNNYGMISLRVCGVYNYKICDPVMILTDYINANGNLSLTDYTRTLVIEAVEKAIHNYNGSSYAQLPTADICKAVNDNLSDTGLRFTVQIQMITPTEETKARIEQAMQNRIFNNQ